MSNMTLRSNNFPAQTPSFNQAELLSPQPSVRAATMTARIPVSSFDHSSFEFDSSFEFRHSSFRGSRRGFTLVELLVVIGIILVLIAIVVVGLRHVNNTAA